MGDLKGVYPGGPGRRGEGARRPGETSSPVRLRSGAEVDDARLVGGASWRRRARTKRLLWGFAAAVAASAALGYTLGLAAHRSPGEIARSMGQDESIQGVLRSERQVILRELWKMEIEEAQRGKRPNR